MGHKWNSPRILAITLERLGNCDAICKHLLISFWSPTSWYPNTRGPWANRRNQSLEPRRMFGRWRVFLDMVFQLVAKSCQSHRIFLEFIECRENSTPWNVTGSLSTVYYDSGFDVIQQKGIPNTSNQPRTTPRCGVVTYKHFVVLEQWLVMTRHLPDLENLHGTFTCQHVICVPYLQKIHHFVQIIFVLGPSQRLLTVIKRFYHVLPWKLVSPKTTHSLQGTTSKTLVVQQCEKHFTGVVVR